MVGGPVGGVVDGCESAHTELQAGSGDRTALMGAVARSVRRPAMCKVGAGPCTWRLAESKRANSCPLAVVGCFDRASGPEFGCLFVARVVGLLACCSVAWLPHLSPRLVPRRPWLGRVVLGLAVAGAAAACGTLPAPLSGPAAPSTAPPAGAGLPPLTSPGATNPAVTQADITSTICVRGWTTTVRPPVSYTNSLKLEVGGNPQDPHNLWPELWDGPRGAHAKDVIENRVHGDVCDGRLTLAQGQAVFLGDWWNAQIP
jgi:hypothetical protein